MVRVSIALLVVLGCGRAVPPAAPAYVDSEHAPRLELAGNEFFTTTELLGIVDGDDIGSAAAQIERFYTGRGFVTATTTIIEDTIVIEEGPLFRVGSIEVVEFDGSRPTFLGDDVAIGMLVGIPPHSVFARDHVRAAVDRIAARYRALGYENVSVVPITNIDYERNVIDLRIEVLAGQQRREVFILRGFDQVDRRFA